jgi:hypothetical protein
MSRKIATLLVVLGTMAASAGFSAAAQAEEKHSWWIAGSAFTGTAELAETTKVVSNFKLEMHGEGILFTIECEGVKIKGAKIENATERSDPGDTFEKCIAVGKPECTVSASTTQPLKAVVAGTTGAFKLKFEPKTGTEIGKWTVSGALCSEKGSYLANGTMICNYNGIETEALEHPLEFTTTSGSNVKVGGVSSKFTLTYEDKLASGQKWSFR